jgi:peptidoglycan hydrolase-like protein with peptidoglycan-binding domain
VLGAALYYFATDFGSGAEGTDVLELQKILIQAGYLQIEAPTGFFGLKTQAAVRLYQAANSIQTIGYVGPITRAALNLGIAPKTVEEQIADLMAQLKALQAQQ